MPLVIIKADEVRDGEPRVFAVNDVAADSFLRNNPESEAMRRMLHVRPHASSPWCKAAIVDRPDTEASVNVPSPPTVDPRREAFWSAAYCAALSDDEEVDDAAKTADLALAEWDRRWGGGK